ncbi:MAG: MFS transporter [Desulfosoma sp.]|uniref:MFS transporter n=1 Tax=Desulfosoma sp. TaxID=2603217 RepID=UPI00404A22EC
MKESRIIFILGLAGFVVMADNWVVSPILPAIACSIRVAPAQAGFLITAYMIPFGLFQLVFGPLADRYGKRQVITFSMVFFTIGTALCGLGMCLYDLSLYRAITGVFAASVMPIGVALIADVVPMEWRQQAIGTFLGIAFLGQGLSMAVGGSIAYFVSWRGVFFVYAGLSVVSTVLLFLVGRTAPSKRNPGSQFIKPYLDLVRNRGSLLIYLVILAEGILIIGSFSYLGAYTEYLFKFNYFAIGLTLTAFGAGAVVTGRLVGKIVPRIGRLNTLSLGLLSAMIADGIFFIAGIHSVVLITGVALLGIGFMLAHSSLLTLATEFAKAARGTAMSLVAFCFMGGGGVGTAIGGKIIGVSGYSHFYLFFGMLLFGLLIAARLAIKQG